MKKSALAGLVVVLLGTGIGYSYYSKIAGRIVQLTPDVIAELQAQTAQQNESLIEKPYAPRKLQPRNPNRNVYFGDLHVHTALSFDSYLFGNRNSLDDAYQFVNGESLNLESGEKMRLSRPLDFVAMTDHAESFALHEGCASPGLTQKQQEFCSHFDQPSVDFFRTLRAEAETRPPRRTPDLCSDKASCLKWEDSTWSRVKAAADHYNKPGEFTAFASVRKSSPQRYLPQQHHTQPRFFRLRRGDDPGFVALPGNQLHGAL